MDWEETKTTVSTECDVYFHTFLFPCIEVNLYEQIEVTDDAYGVTFIDETSTSGGVGPAYHFEGNEVSAVFKTKDPTIRIFAKELKKKDDFYVKMRLNLYPSHTGVIFGIYGEEPGDDRVYFELGYDGFNTMDKCEFNIWMACCVWWIIYIEKLYWINSVDVVMQNK